jgi:hypothetical protein
MTDRELRPYTETALHTLASSVAAALDGTWTVTKADPLHGRGLAVLAGPGTAVLHIQPSYPDTSRLTITGACPQTRRDTRDITYSIGVSADRRGAVIAREITRRLLPAYLAALAQVLEYNETEGRNTATRDAVMTRAAALFGLDPSHLAGDGHHSTQVSLSGALPGSAYGTVTANGAAETLGLDLHGIPADTALRILAELARAVPAGSAPVQRSPRPDPGPDDDEARSRESLHTAPEGSTLTGDLP